MVLAWGYPFGAAIIANLGILNSEPINIGFRALYLGLTIYLLVGACLHRNSVRLTKLAWLFLIFIVMYIIRMVFDMEIRNLRYGKLSPLYVYAYSLGNTFIPALAVFLTAKYCDYRRYFVLLYGFLLLINIMLITFVIRTYGFNFELFIVRNMLDVDTTDKTRAVIGPITYSFTGEILAVLSLYFLLFKEVLIKSINRKFLLFTFLLGFINLILGASRSPFIGFVLASFIILVFYLKDSKKTRSFYKKILSVIFAVFAGIIILMNTVFKDSEIFIFSRFETMVDKQVSGQGEHRNDQWLETIDKFYNSPIIGDAFVLRRHGSLFVGVDPHNVFLEVFMALGVVGASIFYIVYFGYLSRFYVAFANSYKAYFLFAILMCCASFSMLTSSKIPTGYKWIPLLSFVLSIPYSLKKEKKDIG